jgi:peptidoglycan/xylan/chitin deacetylase (PgdA/CDA1 family)
MNTSVVFRFDDSLKNTFDVVYPEFQRREWKASIGVITGHVGGMWADGEYRDKPQMTINELRVLRDEGWDLCGHSVTHPRFPELTESEATFETTESRRWILNNLCVLPLTFLYPYGEEKYNHVVRDHYAFERVIEYGPWVPAHSTRIGIYGGFPDYTDLSTLLRALEPVEVAVLLFHSVLEGGEWWEHTPEQFLRILDLVEASDLRVRTIQYIITAHYHLYPTIVDRIVMMMCRLRQWLPWR